MQWRSSLISALAAVPLFACGAAPDGDVNTDTSTEEVSAPPGGKQAPRSINFDDDGFGTALTDSEDVSSGYTLRGVTFACEGGCDDHGVFTRVYGESGFGVSVRAKHSWESVPQPEFDAYFGVVRGTFIRPASAVTIDAYAMPDGRSSIKAPSFGTPWLKAYDVYGNEVDEDNGTPVQGQWQTLSLASGTYDIAYVEFSASTAAAYNPTMARFDNLTFDQAPIKQPPIQPAPTSGPTFPPRLP